ncbi:hypothetical protein C2G38_2228373 [Gigaspora rosea]|uniref:C2H2-type domain-containing protein n=1 Tax=Gigaspora rosea TaxID=44941 RepID=A0A397TXW0_9GLOM|nr:hypothetical protein C2G38_2228373 [Gigaspora rosea]
MASSGTSSINKQYLTTPVQLRGCMTVSTTSRQPSPPLSNQSLQQLRDQQLLQSSSSPFGPIRHNATAQKQVFAEIEKLKKGLDELNSMALITTNPRLHNDLRVQITAAQKNIKKEEDRIKSLKRHANNQQKSQMKKLKALEDDSVVIRYDSPGRPPLLFEHPNLHEQIHSCIEFGEADARRRREIIKVRTANHLRSALETNYSIYMSRTTMRNYILPRSNRSLAARTHHHPAFVGIAGVSKDERNDHLDGHYCLASVKNAKQFAGAFADFSVVLSQDDKAKVPVGIPAVGKHFRTMQTIHESVSVADHDFPIGSSQKLIPSVYLAINPNENESQQNGQLAIFIRAQWHIGSSSTSHMVDLLSLVGKLMIQIFQKFFINGPEIPLQIIETDNEDFAAIFKRDQVVKPLWVILVDGGPDENPRHLKNINQYCKLFRYLDLDYITIRTHAPGQSSYNPVERSMATLSGKLAGITLEINHFGNHLNSQGEICDYELGLLNFCHAGQALADLWKKDPINGKPVYVEYIDEKQDPFVNLKLSSEFETTNVQSVKGDEMPVPWSWVESHCQICRYSLDIKKWNDLSCCTPKRAVEAAAFLGENNGFLPPVIKGKDGHYLNAMHTLQYFNNLKIPAYDSHLPSLSTEDHSRRCCKKCEKYFPTTTMLVKHNKTVHPKSPKRRSNQQTQTNSVTLDDFSMLPSYSEMWPKVVVETQSFSDTE